MSSSNLFSIIIAILLIIEKSTICCLSKNNVTFDCVPREKNTLMRLKASFSNDTSNNRLSSWKNNSDCCTWQGIECDNVTGHVVKLDLRDKVVDEYSIHPNPDSNKLISDTVDSSLLELKHLCYLDLSGNDFQGSSIPTFLGWMKHLQYLNLSHANFAGIVPHQLGNLSSLHTLDLRGGQYSGNHLIADDVTWAGNLSSLEYLDLSYVNLKRTKYILKVLTTLPSLVDLRLSNTGLDDTNLPHTNCLNSTLLFTNVQHLNLSSNSFGENSSFCFLLNMTSIRSLDLSLNSIHQKVDWISDFLWDKCHLKSLNLGNNRFYGDISGAFNNLSGCWGRNLESLDISYNQFNGHLPEELSELKQLTELHVGGNKLSGHIPSSLGNLRALRVLDLSNNHLGGEIPISLGQLSNLESILISNNSLEGTLSEAHFDMLSRLEYLGIGSNYKLNKFHVGDDWVPPFQLKGLMMESNRIEGQFPQWIQTQKSLQILDLRNCSIMGILPAWLGSFMNLIYLRLSNNHLEGTLPAWLGSLVNLTVLDLPNNHIEGSIPELHSSLTCLNLFGNFINGSIPESLCRMKDLYYLDLSRNHLSGHLPDCNWRNLNYAKLSSNQLSGPIPNSIGGAYQLRWLQLSNNNFTGQIPFTLKNCTSLYFLDVGDNKLSGELPEWIGNHLLDLSVLRVRNNKLDGDISSAYCQLHRLQIMDFAHNQLTGNIPHCFGDLSGMTSDVGGFHIWTGNSGFSEMMKGALLEYTGNSSQYLVNLDLSSNYLFGDIPSELTNLTGLKGLNLSHNHLRGTIPLRIGHMNSLESFDLSSNSLSGTIPESLSKLTSLSHLNLSNNDLSGQIPTGPQLQTLNDHSIYEGNPRLCGDPLLKKCRIINNEAPQQSQKVENDDGGMITDKIYLYAFICSGFATGFWGYFGVLVFKRSWRLALFRYMDVVIGKMLGRY